MGNDQELLSMSERVKLAGATNDKMNLVWMVEEKIKAHLKAMGYEQVWTKCPECIDGKIFSEPSIKGRDVSATLSWGTRDCPTCKGTGKITKYVPWDREKVAEWLEKYCPQHNALNPGEVVTSPEMIIKRYRADADQLHKELTGGE